MFNLAAEVLLLLILLDTYLFWIHVLMHKVPSLWEIHKFHHISYSPNFHVFEFCALWLLPMITAWFFNMTGAMFVVAFAFVFEVGVTHKTGYRASKLHKSLFKPFRSFLGTAGYHKKHHDDPSVNFTQLFTFWDWVMGTKAPRLTNR